MFFSEASTGSSKPARLAARKHSRVSASMPLIITERIILIAAAPPVLSPAIVRVMSRSLKHRHQRRRMRPREQHRRAVFRPADRGDHRDVDITRFARQQGFGFLLPSRRYRIDVEVERVVAQMRRDRARRLDAGSRRHRGDDNVGLAHRLGGGGGEPHAHLLPGGLEPRAVGLRKQNVPGGDMRRCRCRAARTRRPGRPRRNR